MTHARTFPAADGCPFQQGIEGFPACRWWPVCIATVVPRAEPGRLAVVVKVPEIETEAMPLMACAEFEEE